MPFSRMKPRIRLSCAAEFAQLVEDLAVGLLFEIGLDDARQQLVLRIGARSVADHALVFGELVVEQERVVPLERSRCRLVLGLRAHAHENPFRITVLMEIVDKIMRYRQKRKSFPALFRGTRSVNPESRDSGYGPADHSGMTKASLQAARWRRSRCRNRTVPCSRARTT